MSYANSLPITRGPDLKGVTLKDFSNTFSTPGQGISLTSGKAVNGGFVSPNININAQFNFGGSGAGRNGAKPADSSSTALKAEKQNGGDGGDRGGRPKKGGGRSRNESGFFTPSENAAGVVNFSSGIKSGTIVNPQESSTTNYSQLFILNGEFFPESKDKRSIFGEQLGRFIYFSYLTEAQRVVNYKVDDSFKEDDFFDYVFGLCSALQLYYMVDSIIAYNKNTVNTNTGMFHLRCLINADILSKHAELQTFLSKLPIPKNLLDYIRYMYQNFTFSGTPNAPVIRLGYRGTLIESNSIDNGLLHPYLYNKVIDRLIKQSKVIAILSKTFSESVIGEMPPSADVAMLDGQFLTFWHNSNIAYQSKGIPIVNSVMANTLHDLIPYGSFVDDIDGCIYAAASISINDVSQPGLWKSFEEFELGWDDFNKTSLQCYNDNHIVGVSAMAQRIQSGLRSCPHRTESDQSVWELIQGFAPGSVKIQLHSVENTMQATALAVRYLIGL